MRINPETKRILKTEIRLGRTSGGDDAFYIEVVDSTSGLIILDAKLDSEQIANLISNRQAYSNKTEYYGANPNIGLKCEIKTVQVPVLFGAARNMDKIFKKVEKENPGWIADQEKFNHNRFENNGYSVTLRRYVEPEVSNEQTE